ncbi:MAG: hypothetical protein RJA36_2420 [Pseudomonadota bacterium]|jgi:hypothetical protein
MAIYFMQAGEAGPIKIGKSNYVEARLRALSSCHYEPIRLLAVGEGCRRFEGMIHQHFADAHIRHEWFHPVAAILAFIDRVKAGEKPYMILPSAGADRISDKKCSGIECWRCEYRAYAGILPDRPAPKQALL